MLRLRFPRRRPGTVPSRRFRPALETLENRLAPAGIDTTPAVHYSVASDWGSGFQGTLEIVNDQPTVIDDWRLAFDAPVRIDSLWNAQVLEHTGNHYIVTHDGWNERIEPGGRVSLGFIASPGGAAAPTGYVLTWGRDEGNPGGGTVGNVSAAYSVTGDWGSSFMAEVRLTNQGPAAVSSWTLEFDYAAEIGSIWNAQVLRHEGTHYVITHAGWNSTIPVGGSVSFGLTATAAGRPTPSNYVLNGVPLGGAPAPLPTVSAVGTSVTEGDSGTTTALFTLCLSEPATSPVTVTYQTRDGSATAGSDYQAVQGTMAFAPGQSEQTIAVPVLGDTAVEGEETFTLVLAGATNATIGQAEATATIRNDDQVPPPPPPPAGAGFRVTDDWGAGFVAEMTVPNTTGAALANWVVEFDFAHTIGSVWNAALVSRTGDHYVLRHVGWNSNVAAGASIAFGFSGTPGNVTTGPTNVVLRGDAGGNTEPPPGGTQPPPVTGSALRLEGVDGQQAVTQVTLDLGSRDFTLVQAGSTSPSYRVYTSNGGVVQARIVNGTTLHVEALAAGRASLRIEDAASGAVRYLGVRVRTADGQLPGLPDYLAVGSVSEDTPADLAFWRDFDDPATGKRMDVRYIYLNGGPFNGWRTWSSQDGYRVTSYLRESQQLGIVPYFVWYNIPDGGESYYTDRQHVEDAAYMAAYFRDLKFALDLIRTQAPDDPVGFILEPDFLGYMMQNAGVRTDQLPAATRAAYAAGVLSAGTDPQFADTIQGLVHAINYTISKYAPNVTFGWQFNLWASPGITTSIPSTGLMHLTDTMGIEAGRAAIAREARLIAEYYIHAGILSHGADFVSIDKYGLDAGAQNGAATDPARSTWFWNADHWNNYLLFTRVLHETSGLPVVLWQIPVGHINGSQAVNPYDPSGVFPDLANQFTRYEDSAPTFFLGDRFTASGNRLAYFSTNQGGDPKVSVSGNTITWGAHMEEARAAGVMAILFGAGVGESTDGVGSPPTDSYWWIHQVQEYYAEL